MRPACAFFSVARNKLPGYLLPLMPALAIVLAVAWDHAPGQNWWISACALLLVAIPSIASLLPDALLSGITNVNVSIGIGFPFIMVAGAVWMLAWKGRPQLAVLVTALAAVVGAGYLRSRVLPALDEQVSVRAFWRENQALAAGACVENLGRDWEYGLNYYADRVVSNCEVRPAERRIVVSEGRLRLAKPRDQ